MAGGMRIEAKDLPLRYQEQVGVALVAQITQTPPVALREEKPMRNIRPVRRLIFINDRAACRYRILRKQVDSGAIRDLVMTKNDRGEITAFIYVIAEVF